MHDPAGARPIPSWAILCTGLILLVTGCATSSDGLRRADTGTTAIAGEVGPNVVVQTFTPVETREQIVEATEGEIWPLLPAVFDSLGIEVTETKEAQFIIGNPRFRPRRIDDRRLSTFIECGFDHAGAYADQHEVWMTVMVQLLRAPDGATRVTTLVNGSAQPRNLTGSALPCHSSLVLEPRIAELITGMLPPGSRWVEAGSVRQSPPVSPARSGASRSARKADTRYR